MRKDNCLCSFFPQSTYNKGLHELVCSRTLLRTIQLLWKKAAVITQKGVFFAFANSPDSYTVLGCWISRHITLWTHYRVLLLLPNWKIFIYEQMSRFKLDLRLPIKWRKCSANRLHVASCYATTNKLNKVSFKTRVLKPTSTSLLWHAHGMVN